LEWPLQVLITAMYNRSRGNESQQPQFPTSSGDSTL
jgi:hypothetical protein